MEELTRLQASRKGYCSHVTRIFNKADETIAKDADEFSVTYLRTAVDQLQKKKELIQRIDTRIAEFIETPDALETTIYEAEEPQDSILEKINKLQKHIELQTRELANTDSSSNDSGTDSDSEQDNINIVNTSESVITSPQHSIPTTTMSSTSIADIWAPTHTSASSELAEQTLNSLSLYTSTSSTATVSYTHSSGPPPLIPTSHPTSSMAPLRLPTPHHGLYESLPVTTLSYGDSHAPFVSTIPPRTLTQISENPHGTQQFVTSRLPKLTLPSFSGDPLQWQSFWDSFFSSHSFKP